MRGKNHDHIPSQGTEQVEKAIALRRIETGRGLVHNNQLGVSQKSLGNAETLLHAARVGTQSFLASIPEIGVLQEHIHNLLTLTSLGDEIGRASCRARV